MRQARWARQIKSFWHASLRADKPVAERVQAEGKKQNRNEQTSALTAFYWQSGCSRRSSAVPPGSIAITVQSQRGIAAGMGGMSISVSNPSQRNVDMFQSSDSDCACMCCVLS